MTKLLLKLFVNNHKTSDRPEVRASIGQMAGITGIVCNGLLFGGKLIAGILSGSLSIVADALNNLSDISSSLVTVLGVRFARQPADKDHPYGHARYEYLSGLLIAVLIMFIGVELARSGIQKIIHPTPVVFSALTGVIMICSIGMKLWMYGFFRNLGTRIRSVPLLATAIDCRNDVIATAAVLIGCLCEHFFHFRIDGFIGLLVAAFILWSGVNVAKETISQLLGKQADRALVEQIRSLILSQEKVLGIHDLLVHDYGPGQCFASVHAEISALDDPMASHDILDKIERKTLEELNVHLVIHYDPVAVNDDEWQEMRVLVEHIVSGIDEGLEVHDLRIRKSQKGDKLSFDLAVPYSMAAQHEELRSQISAALLDAGKHYRLFIRFDEI